MGARTRCLFLGVLVAAIGVAQAADNKRSPRKSAATNPDKGVAYKWVDENGVTHYGDYVPPQYATKESRILNGQGIEIGKNDAQKTPEQLAEEARETERIVRQKQHDSFLLTTYGSVKDIESLRDERLNQIMGQRRSAETYIDGLHGRLAGLQTRVMTFKPYNESPNARRMPDDLAEDLMRALNEMRTLRMSLASKDAEETALRAQFQSDIERFKELRANMRTR